MNKKNPCPVNFFRKQLDQQKDTRITFLGDLRWDGTPTLQLHMP